MRGERMAVSDKSTARGIVDAQLACVTVSYRSGEVLAELLGSLEAGTVLPAATVVVDNAADDALALGAALPGLAVAHPGRNLGYGGGVNHGVAALDDAVEWVLVTNPDVRVEPDALERLLAVARSVPDAGAVGPRILEPGGAVYPSARELPSLSTGVGHALLANIWPGNPWTRRYRGENRPVAADWRETGWLSGSCLLVRRAAFEAIGGFDESYFMYFEDVDLGQRLAEAGWRNLYAPAATVTHVGATSTAGSAEQMRAVHHDSAYRYLARRYPRSWQAPLRLALRLGLAVRARLTRRG